MNPLEKLLGKGVPEWAQPMSAKVFRDFQEGVEKTCKELDPLCEINWQEGFVLSGSKSYKSNFHNMIRMWRDDNEVQKPLRIREYLHSLVNPPTPSKISLLDSLDRLMIRICDIQYEFVKNATCQNIGNYLLSMLVLDSEQAMVSVTKDQIAESGMSQESLFERAKANLKATISPGIELKETSLGKMTIVVASYFGASFITAIEDFTNHDGRYLVGVPSRDLFVIFEPIVIDSEILQKFHQTIERMSSNAGPYFVLPFILEYQNGEFKDLCVLFEGSVKLVG